jgi:hypothetical protein
MKHKLFSEYLPRKWTDDGRVLYSLTRDHAVKGKIVIHGPNDDINKNRLEHIVIGYEIKGRENTIEHEIYTTQDIKSATYALGEGHFNLTGDMAERIARRVTKYFLQHYSDLGRIGGLFSEGIRTKRDGYVVANTQEYVLQITKYPNMVILKHIRERKEDAFGYQVISEFDGLFDYRYQHRRNIVVVESKTGKIDVDSQHLIHNVFTPLRQMFPNADMYYFLFAMREKLFSPTKQEHRVLRPGVLKLQQALDGADVKTVIFNFHETRTDFAKAEKQIRQQQTISRGEQVILEHRTDYSEECIDIYNGGQKPLLRLVRDPKNFGIYHKIKVV